MPAWEAFEAEQQFFHPSQLKLLCFTLD